MPRAAPAARPRLPPPIFIWKPESCRPKELIADIKQGFYVTELMGMGVNGVTGDYSRGAAGFWIENGEMRLSGFGSHHRRKPQGHVRAA